MSAAIEPPRARPTVYWCHECQRTVFVDPRQQNPEADGDVTCPECHGGFIEEVDQEEMRPPSPPPVPLGGRVAMPGSLPGVAYLGPRPTVDFQFVRFDGRQPGTRQADPGPNYPMPPGPPDAAALLQGLQGMLRAVQANQGPFPGDFPNMPPGDAAPGIVPGLQGGGGGGPEVRVFRGPTGGAVADIESFPQFLQQLMSLGGQLQVYVDDQSGAGPQPLRDFGDYHFGDLNQLLQQLAEQDPNRHGAPPAAKAAVEALPTVTIGPEHHREGADAAQCAVCKDELAIGATAREMPCRHLYHPECILPWLQEHNSCPVCRFELPTDDADYERGRQQGASGGRGPGTRPLPTAGQPELRFNVFGGGNGNGPWGPPGGPGAAAGPGSGPQQVAAAPAGGSGPQAASGGPSSNPGGSENAEGGNRRGPWGAFGSLLSQLFNAGGNSNGNSGGRRPPEAEPAGRGARGGDTWEGGVSGSNQGPGQGHSPGGGGSALGPAQVLELRSLGGQQPNPWGALSQNVHQSQGGGSGTGGPPEAGGEAQQAGQEAHGPHGPSGGDVDAEGTSHMSRHE